MFEVHFTNRNNGTINKPKQFKSFKAADRFCRKCRWAQLEVLELTEGYMRFLGNYRNGQLYFSNPNDDLFINAVMESRSYYENK